MSFQKFATVNIIGGLGNQLHQIAFIKYLENKGFKVRVNLDWYEIDEHKDGTIPRKFELNIKNFDLILSNEDEYNKFERFNYLNNSKKFNVRVTIDKILKFSRAEKHRKNKIISYVDLYPLCTKSKITWSKNLIFYIFSISINFHFLL